MSDTHDTHGSLPELRMTPARREALEHLAEELAEGVFACMKAARHGFDSINPDDPGPTNLEVIADELGDVMAAVDILMWNLERHFEATDWFRNRMMSSRERKIDTVGRYLHHAAVPPMVRK
jgi:NTP pyrophosphatase (non-canonical NTP hydrolase)